jgi:hypothetical protein
MFLNLILHKKLSISRRFQTQETTVPSLIRLGSISLERQLAWEKRVHVFTVCASVTVHVRMRLRECMCVRPSVRACACARVHSHWYDRHAHTHEQVRQDFWPCEDTRTWSHDAPGSPGIPASPGTPLSKWWFEPTRSRRGARNGCSSPPEQQWRLSPPRSRRETSK